LGEILTKKANFEVELMERVVCGTMETEEGFPRKEGIHMSKGGCSGNDHNQQQRDDYANQHNPNNEAYQANNDNHADQSNPNNDRYQGPDKEDK